MADSKVPPTVLTESEKSVLLSSMNMKIASLDRASKGYPVGSSMFLAVREDIQVVKKLIDKIGGM